MNNLGSYRMQLVKLKEKRTAQIKQYIKLADEIALTKRKIKAVNLKIQKWNQTEFQLSEHFIKRFKERVCGIEVSEMKELIFTNRSLSIFNILQDGTYPVMINDNEYQVVLRDKHLITILNSK